MKGWVYVITNKAMPGLVKVGYSMNDPEGRAVGLANTGSPHRYIVDYEMLVEQPFRVEQEAHVRLAELREGREWFRCSVEEAVAAIQSVAGADSQFESFKRADRIKAEKIRLQKQTDERARDIEEKLEEIDALDTVHKEAIVSKFDTLISVSQASISSPLFYKIWFVGIALFALVLWVDNDFNQLFKVLMFPGLLLIFPLFSFLEDKLINEPRMMASISQRDAELSALEAEIEEKRRLLRIQQRTPTPIPLNQGLKTSPISTKSSSR
jgi:T5orf172 domain